MMTQFSGSLQVSRERFEDVNSFDITETCFISNYNELGK